MKKSLLNKSNRKLEGLIYSVSVNVNMAAGVVGWVARHNIQRHSLPELSSKTEFYPSLENLI